MRSTATRRRQPSLWLPSGDARLRRRRRAGGGRRGVGRASRAGAAARFEAAVSQNLVNSMGLTNLCPNTNRPEGSGVRRSAASPASGNSRVAVSPPLATSAPSCVKP